MGYGTYIKLPDGSIYFNRETLHSIDDLAEIKEDSEKDIQQIKERLKMLAASTPKDIFPKEDDVLIRVNSEFNDNWEFLEESFYKMVRSDIVLDELHGWTWESSGDYGDMVREKLNPSNQDDWAKISSGDYLGKLKYESSSLAELDSVVEKIFQRFSFKNSSVKKRYALYYMGKLFRTNDNLFLFSSQEAALDRFLHCMGITDEYYMEISLGSYVKKKYLEAHRDYLESVLARYIIEDDKHSV